MISYSKILITRMVLYLKLDKNNHLWLLWSSLVRTTGEDEPVFLLDFIRQG